MGASKTSSFRTRENSIAGLARALGHPARVAILEYLSKQDSCMCGDIVEHIPLAQATVSQHLAELKKAGLIKGEIDGPRVCYCIDRKAWNEATQLFRRFFADVKECC